MTAKQLLRRARDVDRLVAEAQERADRLRAHLETGRLSSMTGLPRGGSKDWTETADRLLALERKVNARIRELCDLKEKAMALIEGVEEPRLREVLELYYIDGLTWEQAARRMGYSVRNVTYLHGVALQRICETEV